MAQVGQFLKPPQSSNPSATPPAGSGSAKGTEESIVRIPVSNFIRRLGALIFDHLFLWTLARVSAWAFSDLLAANAMAAHYTAVIVYFFYFFLGASPAGKGRTLGKVMMGIEVTNLNGDRISYGQAAIRTLLLYPGLIIILFINPVFFSDTTSFTDDYISQSLFLIVTFPIVIGYLFAIAFNPYKQGCHDFLSKTMVRPAGAPKLEFDEICSLIGPDWRRMQVTPQMMAGGTAIIIAALLIYQVATFDFEEEKAEEFAERYTILQEMDYTNTKCYRQLLPAAPGLSDPDRTDDLSDQEIQEQYIADQETYNRFFADIVDDSSTKTLLMDLTLLRRGLWTDESESERRQEAQQLATEYHDRIISRFSSETVFPIQQSEITNLKNRPLVLGVRYVEALDLYFPVKREDVMYFTFNFDPIDTRPLELKPETESLEVPDPAES